MNFVISTADLITSRLIYHTLHPPNPSTHKKLTDLRTIYLNPKTKISHTQHWAHHSPPSPAVYIYIYTRLRVPILFPATVHLSDPFSGLARISGGESHRTLSLSLSKTRKKQAARASAQDIASAVWRAHEREGKKILFSPRAHTHTHLLTKTSAGEYSAWKGIKREREKELPRVREQMNCTGSRARGA